MKTWLTMREALLITEVSRSTIQDWVTVGDVVTRKIMLGKQKYRIELNTRELLEREKRHTPHDD